MAAKGMSPSVGGTVDSSNTGAKRMRCRRFDASPTGFGVYVILATDHWTFDVSATFFRESISRLIIMERYLSVESL